MDALYKLVEAKRLHIKGKVAYLMLVLLGCDISGRNMGWGE
jgi:hypothetical protein